MPVKPLATPPFGLLARKGQARPALDRPTLRERPAPRSAAAGTAAFTLRLDPARHLRLRAAASARGCSAQQFVTGALDAFFLTEPEVEAQVAHLPPLPKL